MKERAIPLTIHLLIFMILLMNAVNGKNLNETREARVRQPAVSGKFYPGEKSKLRSALDSFFQDAKLPVGKKPIALVVPHAGYIFSGQIAADAFNQTRPYSYHVVVILGTNHTISGFQGIALYPGTGFQTPLGTVPIDQDLAEQVAASCQNCSFRADVHAEEHSIEVQLPFIQYAFPNAMILPLVISTQNEEECARFGETLGRILQGREALIVASSDLSHYPTYQDAISVDQQTLESLKPLDIHRFHRIAGTSPNPSIHNLHTRACGEGPIMAAMAAARQLGATEALPVSYANSGDAMVGNQDRVVGYGAVIFTAERSSGKEMKYIEKRSAPEATPLTIEQQHMLLTFARKTIRQFLASGTVPMVRGFDPALWAHQGAFVTLMIRDQLRGCVGHVHEDRPLCQVVGTMALQAAFGDRRFSPVSMRELPNLDIEISVLSPCAIIDEIQEIRIGEDGVMLTKGDRKAVFLPEVATTMGWDRETLLDELCLKAGMSPGSWRENATIYRFQTTKFQESDFHPN